MSETRNASLADLAAVLTDEQARKIDVVAPLSALSARNGVIEVAGAEPVITMDGVTDSAGRYNPTSVFDGQLAEQLDIPGRYLSKLRAGRTDMYDLNVNGMIHGGLAELVEVDGEPVADYVGPANNNPVLFRGFRADGGVGVARALLSDRYAFTDHLDVLTATLEGVRASGVPIEVLSCDLTDRRMYVKIAAPSVAALAPTLLAGYRTPFRQGAEPWNNEAGRAHGWLTPDEQPVVFAGFIISNSEVGHGAFSITPQVIVKVCRNGLTIKGDAIRAIHMGGKLEEGIVRWSEDTQRKNLDVIAAKARDAVATFLDVEYVKAAVARLERLSGHPVADAAGTIAHVGKALNYSDEHIKGVLDHFVLGGQLTAGGICQAVTSFAQTVPDADAAYALEESAIQAMELAVRA